MIQSMSLPICSDTLGNIGIGRICNRKYIPWAVMALRRYGAENPSLRIFLPGWYGATT